MIRAGKICTFLAGVLCFIWAADYGFLLVSEKSTMAVFVGFVVLLILLAIAITFVTWVVKKTITKFSPSKEEEQEPPPTNSTKRRK